MLFLDDADLPETTAEVRYYMNKHRLESVAGVLYGVECSEPHIVPVPIHSGYEKIRRPIDLYHRFYVHTLNTCHNRVSKYEEYTMDVGTWPKDSNSGAKYVIYVSNGTGGGSNHLIRSLAGGKNLIQKGNVLVVKTDLEGVVCDVRYKDLRVVSDMVVKILWEAQFKMVPEFWARVEQNEQSVIAANDT